MDVKYRDNLNRQTERKQEISADLSRCLKGTFAVCVLMHHLYQHSGLLKGTIIGCGLQAAGYLSVSVFFFLSGYGLLASYQGGGESYIRSFPRRRILPFLGMIMFFSAIYLANGLLRGNTYAIDSVSIWKALVFGSPIIVNGWYLQVQLLLYMFFFVTCYSIKDHKLQIVVIGLECLALCTALFLSGYYSTWFESIMAFPAGILWRIHGGGTHSDLPKKTVSRFCRVVVLCVFFGGTILGWQLLDSMEASLLCKMISAILFPMMVVEIAPCFPVENRITRWFGEYSVEIYAFQGLFLGLFHSRPMIENPYLYIFLVSISVLVTAVIIHPVTKWLFSATRKQRN